jgi:hypothetical protein
MSRIHTEISDDCPAGWDDVAHQWAARDCMVDGQHLPKGLVMIDTVQIEYPQ